MRDRALHWQLLLAVLTVGCAAALSAKPVSVTGGLVEGVPGVRNPATTVYRGIPYAAPPVGELRWKEPQPVVPWKGVKKAAEFGASCMQTNYPETSLYRSRLGPVSEDCLTLNVWTTPSPAATGGKRQPVMVWIHGGSLIRGAGSAALYDGEALSRKGVVVVTINYRLGAFGFLAHAEAAAESPHHTSGNYGMLDQLAALEWVKRNATAFGGDPGNVTIFGESAGSLSTNCLMASPLTRGLIHRVVGESGAFFLPMKKLADAGGFGARAGDLKTLRAKSAKEILGMTFDGRSQGPVVDGYLLPAEIRTIFAEGKQTDVPFLGGYNADEATAFVPSPGGLTQFNALAKQTYGAMSGEFLKVFHSETDAEARKSVLEAFRDHTFGSSMRTWGRMAQATGHHPVYLYYFTRVPPGPTAERFGAYHAAEIAYVFRNLGSLTAAWDETDEPLADAMSSYWVNFAKTGDPNGPGLPRWPVYKKDDDSWLELGVKVQVRQGVNREKLDFFDRFFAKP